MLKSWHKIFSVLSVFLCCIGCQSQASKSENFLAEMPKISTHEHYRAGGNLEAYFEVMPSFNIQKVILLPTGGKPDNRGYEKHMAELLQVAKEYPERIIPYASVNEADSNAPQVLEAAVQNGARGLKLLGGHPNLYHEPFNSPKMMALFKKVEELQIPVLMHISPIKIPKQLKEFEDLVRAFPDVTIVAAHYGRTAPFFTEGARLLDHYPNLFMDVSMGGGLPRYEKEIRLYRKKYRDFIFKYQDRLMWGTDVIINSKTTTQFLEERIGKDFIVLGNSLDLPRPILEKIFYKNPRRILKIE